MWSRRGSGLAKGQAMNRALLVVLPLLGLACSSGESSAPATDDSNEINKSAIQLFACKTDKPVDGKLTEIKFAIGNIADKKKVEVLDKAGNASEDDMPIETTPKDHRLAELNDNLGVATGTRLLRISGDSDGFYLLDLTLYKDKGYTKGYVHINGLDPEEAGPSAYSTVTCTVTPKK
jgi:hypothetical protein